MSNKGDADPGCASSVGRDDCNVCGGPGKARWYDDTDGDSLGDPASSQLACTQPTGFVDNKNDTDPGCPKSVGRDVCNVCGGPGKSTWYDDSDDDGLGDPASSTQACTQPSGYVSNSEDKDPTCDDDIGRDVCGVCGGPGKPTWYEDTDGDGLGDPAVSTTACAQPGGYAANSSDDDPTCHVNLGRDECGECGGNCVRCQGDMDVQTEADLAELAVCDEVIGTVSVHGPALTSIGPLPLRNVIGQLRFGYDANLDRDPLPNVTRIDLPNITYTSSTVLVVGNPVLTSVNLPLLTQTSFAGVDIKDNPQLSFLDISELKYCGGNLEVSDSLLTTISAPNLVDTGGVIVEDNVNLTHIEMPDLVSNTGHLWIESNDNLASWSFGSLESVDVMMRIQKNPSLSECLPLALLEQIGSPGGSFNQIGNLSCSGTCTAGVCE